MNPIQSVPSIGELYLEDLKGNVIEVHNLGVGRLSVTPQKEFWILNFWVRSESSYRTEWGDCFNVWGPTLEVVHPLEKEALKTEEFILQAPTALSDSLEEEAFYSTGYYNGFHQEFASYELVFQSLGSDGFRIHFRGSPSKERDTFLVRGVCQLPLHSELQRYW